MANASGLWGPSVPSLRRRGQFQHSIAIHGSGFCSPEFTAKRVFCSSAVQGADMQALGDSSAESRALRCDFPPPSADIDLSNSCLFWQLVQRQMRISYKMQFHLPTRIGLHCICMVFRCSWICCKSCRCMGLILHANVMYELLDLQKSYLFTEDWLTYSCRTPFLIPIFFLMEEHQRNI